MLSQNVQEVARLVIDLLENRFELFALEFREEQNYVIRILLWGLVALFFSMFGLATLTFSLLLFLPVEWRGWAFLTITVCYFILAVIAWIKIRTMMRRNQMPFATTREELKKDRQCF